MSRRCGCGNPVDFGFQSLGCLECGAGCCPACAISVESVTYCRGCADTLLGVRAASPGVFDLH
jgi:hypothetical protein